MKNILLLIIIFLLQSCVTPGYWYKDGSSQDDFAKTRYICLKEAQHPSSNLVGSYAKEQGYLTSGFSMKTNGDLFNSCMNAYGFYWKTNNRHLDL